jgi:DNA-binding transcriptional MerR regulator
VGGVMASERIKRPPPHKRPSSLASALDKAISSPLRIGEAAKLVGVEAYVLRFWETQFPFIRPKQSHSRHRYYTGTDIETLKIVKRLLHTEGYTIAGARRFMREKALDRVRGPLMQPAERVTKRRSEAPSTASNPATLAPMPNNGVHRTLREIREDLRALHKLLGSR